jgi:chorismate dehydratase
MTQPRISASSYSNTAPLIWSFLYGSNRGKYELILDNAPARSAELLSQGRVDAALIPIIEYQRNPDLLLIPDVCVGAIHKVESVCLITDGRSLEEVSSVALDISSKTSVSLAKILFAEFIGNKPVYQDSKPDADLMLKSADCALLIGDPALMVDESKFRKFDLATEWNRRTGLGFIFAMWTCPNARRENASAMDFAGALDEGLGHIEDIISNYEKEIPIGREEFRAYLSETIIYKPTETMMKGLRLYIELALKHGLIDSKKDLRFLG